MTERELVESLQPLAAILQEIAELADRCVTMARANNAALREVVARFEAIAEGGDA
jgi:hypothetical protein